MRGSLEGMFNLRQHVTDIMVGNNEVMTSVSIGQYKGLVLKADGTTMDLTLKDVLYIPKLMVNLFSLTKALETKGVKLSSQGQIISLIYGPHEICFDKVFKHGSGRLLGIDIHPNPNHIAVTAQTVDINTVHNLFGHPNAQVLSATAQKYGFKTKNTLQVCPNCAISKAKQKNLHQITTNPSTEIGGKINIDISSVLNPSYGGANFWLLIQDDFTGYLWSYFLKHKSDLPSTMIDWLYQVKKELKLAIKVIRLDNSGENMAFHKLIQFKPEFHIKFEFTAPGTPQQNGKVERAFATLFGKTRSMLNAARITIPLRKGLWAHCAALSVQLENIIVKEKY